MDVVPIQEYAASLLSIYFSEKAPWKRGSDLLKPFTRFVSATIYNNIV
ncbi:hypothetical protein FLA_4760 [Filimonas lacunae]|nr:hypothetical protein FLA_4760 [Filimonas lacunae]